MSDPDLASQMAQLSDNLRALRPGLDRGPVEHARGRRAAGLQRRRRGGRRAGRPRGARAASSAQGYPARPSTTSTWTRSRSTSAPARPRTSGRCGSWSASSSGRASCSRGDDGLRLTPRAVRRLGETALKRVFAADRRVRPRATTRTTATGSADELTGTDPARGCSATSCRSTPSARCRNALRRGGRHPAARLLRRGLRGGRDRAAYGGGGGALRRPVVLDGARRAAGGR